MLVLSFSESEMRHGNRYGRCGRFVHANPEELGTQSAKVIISQNIDDRRFSGLKIEWAWLDCANARWIVRLRTSREPAVPQQSGLLQFQAF
jgi:hypothetical protein